MWSEVGGFWDGCGFSVWEGEHSTGGCRRKERGLDAECRVGSLTWGHWTPGLPCFIRRMGSGLQSSENTQDKEAEKETLAAKESVRSL